MFQYIYCTRKMREEQRTKKQTVLRKNKDEVIESRNQPNESDPTRTRGTKETTTRKIMKRTEEATTIQPRNQPKESDPTCEPRKQPSTSETDRSSDGNGESERKAGKCIEDEATAYQPSTKMTSTKERTWREQKRRKNEDQDELRKSKQKQNQSEQKRELKNVPPPIHQSAVNPRSTAVSDGGGSSGGESLNFHGDSMALDKNVLFGIMEAANKRRMVGSLDEIIYIYIG